MDTPMMRQYLSIKAQHPDAVVFYRMGDFYEMFLRDAELAAPLLDIALTSRDKGKADAIPMCGVPVHAADQHIKRLAGLGYRVAICEQVEIAKAAVGRGLVRREVVEVVTPGLVGDPEGIDAATEWSIVFLMPGRTVGVAVLDASTGDLRATEIAEGTASERIPEALLQELQRIGPREIVVPERAVAIAEQIEREFPEASLTRMALEEVGASAPSRLPDGLSGEAMDSASVAARSLLAYVARNQPSALTHTCRLRRYALNDAMILDEATRGHLELFRNSEDGSRARTLLARLDLSVTALGARRLARWIAYPLLDPEAIRCRQAAVAYLVDRGRLRARLRESLRPVRDLERLLARVARPTATPRDLGALRASLEALPAVAEALCLGDEQPLDSQLERPAALAAPAPAPQAASLLREAIADEPPALLRGSRGANETGYVRAGFHAELDALREGVQKGREWIAGLEVDERRRAGIPTLKIRFHPVHGYSIEVSKSHLSRVPENYERKQTLANAERFTTPVLREIEQKIVGGRERAAALERVLFEKVRQAVLEHAAAIGQAAEAAANLDALASFAEVARRDEWVRPEVEQSEFLEIRGGRHPVVEPLLAANGGDEFVPNDAILDSETRQIVILTGPNMSGKSTYLRQVALIVLLAQIGSFVPADSARIGVVDRVFTRVGASDRLARGESTFMVEMRETAEILAQATRRSLIILDEIGRGTSTFDGLSIAWAVAEYLHDYVPARTLFATHYHELTDLARAKERVANAHFEAREWGDEVLFLRRLAAGGASRSYGIQVARLAGLPHEVIERAREILGNLEGGELDELGQPRLANHSATSVSKAPERVAAAPDQLRLFSGAAQPASLHAVIEALRTAEPDAMTPLDALVLVARLRQLLCGEEDG
jgi:DNA mismatch repair protein MutS